MTHLQLEQVRKSFINGEIEEEVLKGVDLSLQKGEVTALIGASGSGKSTLLTIAAGLQPLSSGRVLFENQNLAEMRSEQVRNIRAHHFGFVFQSSHLVPFLTVEEQLSMMMDVAEMKINKHDKRKQITDVLEKVGMTHRLTAYPSSLSGGEKQRVAVARAIIHNPTVLFADEPTASLDSKKSKDTMALIQHVTKSLGMTTLTVTHDEEMLAYADHIVTMSDGKILKNRATKSI
ncbi:ABC transporter ATP-binding protein [Bacillus sp. N1-1]|jgi:ABC-type lipoprotein export system ATPase subunit|uniref:ABC transporter ATP-binding protein n=1 Tax=Bacillus sp. N1-1 TaxID=2682541 RepID=UPI0013180954|nr:ABC transporter ATP-binding protein [Bacillus sp. N1-1]QHA91236.1 ATP-binding cassette domain-containing protein [Bacillus sp. N1-1]